jgi:hypothetical protein
LKNFTRKFHPHLVVAAVITAATTVFFAWPVMATQVLTSPNYEVVNPTFSAGGQSSNSTHYISTQTIGTPDTGRVASTTYNSFFGFRFQAYPGIPGTPTIANTGGNLYNSLNFVITNGNDTSDTNFAVAISPNAFASTTYYLQNNDTLGSSAYWQSYTAWGGATGQLITGLSPSTTYTIKVKARYSANTESDFSSTASAATVAPSISFSISGVSLGTNLAGVTTTIGTSSTAMSFSTLPVGSSVIAAQTLSVTTNATGGYTTTLFQDGNLRNSINQIQPVSASNASPAAWPSTVTTSAIGYHTTAATLCTGTLTRFSSNNTYAAATTTPSEVACSTAAVTAASTSIVYQLQIGNLQQAGNYANTITYITTAIY